MKVYIGPYISWFGPYQLADKLMNIGLSEDRCYKIGQWLDETWISDVLSYIYNKRKRIVKVKIHEYDIWSLDHTLSFIIRPSLEKMKNRVGVPCGLDADDYPIELACPPDKVGKYGNIPIEYSSKQWDYVLNEMIWAFKSIEDENDLDMSDDEYERQKKGLILFGKYFRCLWD